MATEPERTIEKTSEQKRGIVITVSLLAILASIGFISVFFKEWR